MRKADSRRDKGPGAWATTTKIEPKKLISRIFMGGFFRSPADNVDAAAGVPKVGRATLGR